MTNTNPNQTPAADSTPHTAPTLHDDPATGIAAGSVFLIEPRATHTAILRDGLAVAVVPSGDVLAWFHRHTNQSMDWELTHNGYALETGVVSVPGWQAFELFASRRGYGVAGSLARLAVEIAAMVSAFEGSEFAPGEWRDAAAAPGIVSMLEGFERLLQCAGQTGNFAALNGSLSQWAHDTAARIGEELNN